MRTESPRLSLDARRRGAAATEYILILTFVVIPMGLLLFPAMRMINTYATRMVSPMHLPFP